MYNIFVDDVRDPINADRFNKVCRTTDETIKLIRRKYKEGVRNFYLSLDNDAGSNSPGGDFINILQTLEQYVRLGKMKDLNVEVYIHSMNPVAKENMRAIIQHNDFLTEVW